MAPGREMLKAGSSKLVTRSRPFTVLSLFALSFGSVSCSAGGGGDAAPTASGGRSSSPPPNITPPDTTMVEALPPGPGPAVIGQCADAAQVSVAPTPLRRISRTEYNNTVTDLFGDASRPADVGGFPSDETVGSFVSNTVTLLTPTNNEGYLFAAEGIAERARQNFASLSGCSSTADAACAKSYLSRVARRAFRGTLEPSAETSIYALYDDAAARSELGPDAALELGLRDILLSPRFLFAMEFGGEAVGNAVRLTPGETAGRLASFLWRSVPDDALLAVADAGGLTTAEQIRAQASAMLGDARAARMLDQYVLEWLDIGDADRIARDAPEFTTTLRDHMRKETLLYFRNIVQAGVASYVDLMTANVSLMSPDLAAFYGATYPTGVATSDPDGFTPVALPDNRRGILLLGAFLATHAQPNRPSQVLRGLAVREQVLCDRVLSPPPGVERNPPIGEGQTAQSVLDEHANNPTCVACHQFLDPVGRGFGFFDQIGRYGEVENGVTLTANGQISPGIGVLPGLQSPIDRTFQNALELVDILATETYAQQCFAVQVNRFALGRDEQAADACSVKAIWDGFSPTLTLRDLFINVAVSDAFLHRNPVRAGEVCR